MPSSEVAANNLVDTEISAMREALDRLGANAATNDIAAHLTRLSAEIARDALGGVDIGPALQTLASVKLDLIAAASNAVARYVMGRIEDLLAKITGIVVGALLAA